MNQGDLGKSNCFHKTQVVSLTVYQPSIPLSFMPDNVASSQSQLSGTEVSLLIGAVIASGIGPILFPGTSVTELLAPAAAACKYVVICCEV